ncbi:MAG: zinc ribbon domain-containing protein [Cytophagales bacterium]|nr:zinc ribbon domain-containing protein [Rhizobacter sp.]
MPIYAYRCEACGHAKDVLQKISDPVLTDCPACGASAFKKQVTAAGFQLKGSGWYVTDFRGGTTAAGEPAKPGAPDKPDASNAGAAAPAAAPAASSSSAPAASTPAAAPPPATGGSSSGGQ